MIKRIFTIMLLASFGLEMSAQCNQTFISNLKTLQVKVNGAWGEPPVMLLGGSNFVEISFDDLQHDYVRYSYTITHCNANWEKSDLYSGDYMTGINGSERIDDYEQSMNTEMMYNHYHFRIPNENVKLLVSGNYKIDIMEDGDDEPVATACFSVTEGKIGVDATISGNTDIDTYEAHQQVDFNINYQQYPVTNPEAEFYPVVVQNNRWDNHVENLKPTYLRTNQLVYTHNRNLIFEGGNEYRRMEILNEYSPTMHVDKMYYEDPFYHAQIMEDDQRKMYKYDEDQDGNYWIRNSDNVDNETESDYFFTHFTLKMPKIAGGELYINGDLTNNIMDENSLMEYDIIDHAYKITLPLKQGSYNYQYLFLHDGDTTGTSIPAEGSFHQTENEYYIYIYHRPFGGRYDKLVGFRKLQHKI